MNRTADLLFEIGCEEIPAKIIDHLRFQLSEQINAQFKKVGIAFEHIESFATPRRLACLVKNLSLEQPAQALYRRGPAKKAAFDSEGNPTLPCMSFARSVGVSVEELGIETTDKGEWVVFKGEKPGELTEALLPELIQNAVAALAIPKPMRWSDHDFYFIRPVHSIVLYFGDKNIPVKILGCESHAYTLGHRFLKPEKIKLTNASDYSKQLREAYVMVSVEERKEHIRHQLRTLAESLQAQVVIDEALLQEVTGLVEWPHALLCTIDASFLSLPAEVIICAMHLHQKCFHLVDSQQKILPYFITVSNIKSQKPEVVIKGNERVMRARLSDAAFFFASDSQISLQTRLQSLKTLSFQKKLGSIYQKTERIAKLAHYLAKHCHAKTNIAERAGLLCKSDLVSDMVFEFPELQGIMGGYYAANDKEDPEVAQAIREHYFPRFSQDLLPSTLEGCIVSLADRVDTLLGIFGIGQKPSGDQDPFALKRAAIGLVRILVEKNISIDLRKLLEKAASLYQDMITADEKLILTVHHFIVDRLISLYQEKGVASSVLYAILERQAIDLADLHKRVDAVSDFISLTEAEALAAANKRVKNILRKEENNAGFSHKIQKKLLKEPAEIHLAEQIELQKNITKPLLEAYRYRDILQSLASLRDPIDRFFETVMVKVDDPDLSANRLALLHHLQNLFLQVADISKLELDKS